MAEWGTSMLVRVVGWNMPVLHYQSRALKRLIDGIAPIACNFSLSKIVSPIIFEGSQYVRDTLRITHKIFQGNSCRTGWEIKEIVPLWKLYFNQVIRARQIPMLNVYLYYYFFFTDRTSNWFHFSKKLSSLNTFSIEFSIGTCEACSFLYDFIINIINMYFLSMKFYLIFSLSLLSKFYLLSSYYGLRKIKQQEVHPEISQTTGF